MKLPKIKDGFVDFSAFILKMRVFAILPFHFICFYVSFFNSFCWNDYLIDLFFSVYILAFNCEDDAIQSTKE